MKRPAPSQNAIDCAQVILQRDAVGQSKYGTSMDRTDLLPGQWLQHLAEEQADALQYGLRLKRKLAEIVREAYRRGHADCGKWGGAWAEDRVEFVVKDLLG